MKNLLFSLLLLSSLCRAQTDTSLCLPIDSEKSVQFQHVIQIDSTLPAKELTLRAYSWADKFFKSTNTIVDQYNPKQGILMIKGLIPYIAQGRKTLVYSRRNFSFYKTQINTERDVAYLLTIETKPGRYRVTLDHMTLIGTSLSDNSVPSHLLPACPQVPDNISAVSKQTRMSKEQIIKQEDEFYGCIQIYVKNLLSDLNTSMHQPVAKKDW